MARQRRGRGARTAWQKVGLFLGVVTLAAVLGVAAFMLWPKRARVTIPEGFHRFDVAKRLARLEVCTEAEFLAASSDRALLDQLGISAPTAEGYLFPDTYRFPVPTEAHAVVRRMVDNYRARTAALFQAHGVEQQMLERDLHIDRAGILTLASIVEKEVAVADEAPMVAGVFLNRLRDPAFVPKRLQSDPTASYGCLLNPALPSCADFDGRHVRPLMLRDANNPYNTYRINGLPPGPICSPGLNALTAVLEPAQHDFLYFVARGERRHAFSRSLGEHNRAIDSQRPDASASGRAR